MIRKPWKRWGHFGISDEIGGILSTAHPHHDAKRKRQYSYVVDFGLKSRYRLFSIDEDSRVQSAVAELPADLPAYMHSFGMSERYLVFAEFPFVVDPLGLLLSNEPFIRNYRWRPELGLRFHVFEKDGGRHVNTAETDAAFSFHHVNAYESGNELIVDFIAYPDADIINQFYLARLRAGERIDGTGQLRRYTVPLTRHGKVQMEAIVNCPIELPRIKLRPACRPPLYRFVWGTGNRLPGDFLDSIVKLDVTSGQVQEWCEDGSYPGEPVFVARPGATGEDDGCCSQSC